MMQTPFNSIFFTFCTLILFLGKRNKLAGAQQCIANPPDINPCSGTGKIEEFGGLSCYLSGPVDSKLAVVLITDVFGYENPHLRMVADKVGASGYYVVVPDFFRGSPFVSKVTNYTEWIKGHSAEKGFEDAKPVIEALRAKGITKIGAVGFCWGAKAVVEFSKIPSIEAAVLMHPSSITVEDIKGVKVPMSILGSEIDDFSPPEKLKQYEEALMNTKPEVDHFVKVFLGCGHGWTLRYDDKDAVAVKNAEEAHKLMLDWLINHVK